MSRYRYPDGSVPFPGDHVLIDSEIEGTVVASIDDGLFSIGYPEAQWAYLGRGLLVDTLRFGLLHTRRQPAGLGSAASTIERLQ